MPTQVGILIIDEGSIKLELESNFPMISISSLSDYLPKDLIQIILSYVESYVWYYQNRTTHFQEINSTPTYELLEVFRTLLQDSQPQEILEDLWSRCSFSKQAEVFQNATAMGALDVMQYILLPRLDKRSRLERWRDNLSGKPPQSFNLNEGLYSAIRFNQFEVVKYLISQGARGWRYALEVAAEQGNLEIVTYFDVHVVAVLNQAFLKAAGKNHLPVVQYLISQGATWLGRACRRAAHCGALDVVMYLAPGRLRPWTLNKSLANASHHGHLEVVKYLISVGATGLNEALRRATVMQEREVVEYLRSQGEVLSRAN